MALSTLSMADVENCDVQQLSAASIPAGNAGNALQVDLGRDCRSVQILNDAAAAQNLFVSLAEKPHIGATDYDIKNNTAAVMRKYCIEIKPGSSYTFKADPLTNFSVRYLYLVADPAGAIAALTKIFKDI